ncbi:unnamed protein product [Rhizophagus irregularis]|nr:unnamed protein product [Rhizophagus irregularis]
MRIPISQQQLEVYPKNEHQLLRNSSLYICVVRKISLSSFGEPVEVKITTLGDLTIFQKFDQFLLAFQLNTLFPLINRFVGSISFILTFSNRRSCPIIKHFVNNAYFFKEFRKCIDIFSDISWRLKVACLNLFKILRLDKLEFDLSVLILEP